jgi:2-polyprenyl-3-methyl-5-hydroxy-6-metoxy-1,4-benzoquinol methylase
MKPTNHNLASNQEGRSKLDKSLLVRVFGPPAMLVHGDPLVLDRWRYLRKRLPMTVNGETLLDIGCGGGAFTIGAARRGYRATGLSWDQRNQETARHRAELCGVPETRFPIQDVRYLERCPEFVGEFDVVICFENIEHILDDRKLMQNMVRCLRPGGMLLLTTPNFFYRQISPPDNGPFSRTEDGWHVRRGYSKAMLGELCADAGLMIDEITYCSGFFSQKITAMMRMLGDGFFGWAATFWLRIFPIICDRLIAKVTGWPDFSICLMAYKPRFPGEAAVAEHIAD